MFDSATKHWLSWLPPPLELQSDLPAFIAPGQALFARADTPTHLEVPESALRIRYYHQDHLGSSSSLGDTFGFILEETAFYPFGAIRNERKTRSSGDAFQFAQKERDKESMLDYFETRHLACNLGRFLQVDPQSAAIPEDWLDDPQRFNSFAYAGNHPINAVDPDGRDWFNLGDSKNPDIQWREGNAPQLKPGVWNWIKNLFGFGEHAESLGKNVLVAVGSEKETVNSAQFSWYSEKNKNGPSATIRGNTRSSDPSKYAVIKEGVYNAKLSPRSKYPKERALMLEGGGKIPTVRANPNPNSDWHDQMYADEIFFHQGNVGRENLFTTEGKPISEGCLTAAHGNPKEFNRFMKTIAASKPSEIKVLVIRTPE
jgi:RHS repeat-associated protein